MKILVVEDNPDFSALMEIVLVKHGYAVERAVNGVEGLQKARASAPDLVISDVMMPEMDGFLFCREIKEDEELKGIPVILYTATHPEKDEEELAHSLGASKFIAKPAEFSDILNAIRSELAKTGTEAVPPRLVPGPAEAEKSYLRVLSRKLHAKERELAAVRGNLDESDARYHELVEAAPEPMAIHGGGVFLYVNRALAKLLGAKGQEEIVGRGVLDFVAPESLEFVKEQLVRTQAEKRQTPVMEIKIMRLDRRPLEVELAGFPVMYKGRSARHITLTDITERKRAEEEVKIRGLYLDNAADSIIVHDFDGTLVYVNETACAAHGYARDEILKINLRTLNVPEQARLMESRIKELREKGEKIFETAHFKKDGSMIPLEVHARVVVVSGKKLILSTVRDITERKLADAALRASEERLRRTQKLDAIGQLSGGIAHDLNNLLGPVMGYAELLRKSFQAGDARLADVDEITRAAERAASLVRQLLAFSRKQVLETRVTDLNGIIEELGSMLQRVINEDVCISYDLSPDAGAVKVDPGQVEQVILNLVLNARDAMPIGGEIIIGTSGLELAAPAAAEGGTLAPGSYVTLSVEDTGVGMDRALREKIFEPFFTTKAMGKGVGLGLSTVYGIVKQSGGEIQVESEPGKGSLFRLYFPLVKGELSVPAAEPAPVLAAGKGRILLVEDDESMRGIAKRVLSGAGYSVLEACEGTQALRILAEGKKPIDLLLTDIVMPGMGGIELAGEVSSKYPQAKILCMSGYVDKEEELEKVLGSKAGYLQKPFTPDELLLKVVEALKE
ncbi:MAG: response regulator [Elusimicrobiales bacterium]|jgi:PAS domain S-box-containing protein